MTALVVYLQNTVARLREREEGQTMAEYALIIGGIAIVVIAGILILGPAIRDLFQETGSSSRTSRLSRGRDDMRAVCRASLRPTARPPFSLSEVTIDVTTGMEIVLQQKGVRADDGKVAAAGTRSGSCGIMRRLHLEGERR